MKLNVQIRTVKGKKVKNLRKENLIPGVVYWKNIENTVMVKFDKQEFLKLYRTVWTSTPITLKWEWLDQMVLVHDYQVDPVTNYLLHVDFLALTKWEKVTASVSIVLEWIAPIEKSWDWRIQQVKNEVEVEAMPKDLPHDIKVDISWFESLNDIVFIKDLKLPKWVSVLDDEDIPVVTVIENKDVVVEEEVQETTTETTESSTEDWEKAE